MNKSGLHPAGRAVLVLPYEEKHEAGLIQLPDSVRTHQQILEQRATVIEVGLEAWKDEQLPRAVPGDRVLVTAYAGYMAVGPKDKVQYRIVNDRDIFATIDKDCDND